MMKQQTNYTGAYYMRCAYDMEQRKVALDTLVRLINRSRLAFDTIVFRGMSGTLVGPSLADRLNKPFIVVRKQGDGSHSDKQCEGHADVQRYIIIDDLIESGRTVDSIIGALNTNGPHKRPTECVGLFLYNSLCPDSKYRNIPIFSCVVQKTAKNRVVARDTTGNPSEKYNLADLERMNAENKEANQHITNTIDIR